MAIHAPSRIRVRFAVAALWVVCAFHAVVHAVLLTLGSKCRQLVTHPRNAATNKPSKHARYRQEKHEEKTAHRLTGIRSR